MYASYTSPTTLDAALRLRADLGAQARVLAGGTDLLVELDRGRRSPDGSPLHLIDLTRIPGLAQIQLRQGRIHLGPLVTHNQCAASPLIQTAALPLARAAWEVGAPQIRNRATVAGNLITASPANDTIPPLLALDATVTLASLARGERTLPLHQFITGFRQVDLAADEILVELSFPALTAHQAGAFVKLGLRKAQAISVVNAALVLTFSQAGDRHSPVEAAAISLGAVAPTPIRTPAAEKLLVGQALTPGLIEQVATLAADAASPIDDVRGSADYRRHMAAVLVARLLRQLAAGQEQTGLPSRPVTLWGQTQGEWPVAQSSPPHPLTPSPSATVNGRPVSLAGGMTLLDSLRQAGFVGVKEGCAEGECGACTVFLDGMAIVACLVPAERAAGSQVLTVEGIGTGEALHPIQKGLIRSGGVQCGYCTPGFVMSGVKLLQERPHPSRQEVAEAFTGNFCRCTGYRKIVDAVVQAGETAQIEGGS